MKAVALEEEAKPEVAPSMHLARLLQPRAVWIMAVLIGAVLGASGCRSMPVDAPRVGLVPSSAVPPATASGVPCPFSKGSPAMVTAFGDSARRAAAPAPSLRVAYASQGDLYLTDDGGPARLLYPAGDVSSIHVSSDGELVAFMRQVDNVHHSLWVVASDGGDARELVSLEHLAAMPTEK